MAQKKERLNQRIELRIITGLRVPKEIDKELIPLQVQVWAIMFQRVRLKTP